MAVVGWRETAKGSGVSGRYGESNSYKRAFLIRVDHPRTSKVAICRAPGIVYGAAHPDAFGCKAMEFDLSMSDDVGLWWTLSVTYYAPPPEQVVTEAGIPADSWAASGGTSTGPAFEDIDGDKIVNSAGDPLEGLEQENDDISWTLTKCYTTIGWDSMRQACSNTVNDSSWSGGDPGTWKVNFRGAQKKSITQTEPGGVNATPSDGSNAPYEGTESQVEYWETTWEFRYRANGWALRPWDVGFNQLVNGERQAIVGEDGKAVKQPVALTSAGAAKPAGEEPDVIAYDVYKTTNFAIFGDPF